MALIYTQTLRNRWQAWKIRFGNSACGEPPPSEPSRAEPRGSRSIIQLPPPRAAFSPALLLILQGMAELLMSLQFSWRLTAGTPQPGVSSIGLGSRLHSGATRGSQIPFKKPCSILARGPTGWRRERLLKTGLKKKKMKKRSFRKSMKNQAQQAEEEAEHRALRQCRQERLF